MCLNMRTAIAARMRIASVGHRRYFDIASAVPSQLGGGGFVPKKGDALAIERVEMVEPGGVQLLAFAGQRFGAVPVLGPKAAEKLGVLLGKSDEALRLLQRVVAEQREDARRLGLALHLEEIELDEGEVGRSRGRGLAHHGADVVGLRLALEPRGHVDVVADHRIVEARLRAEIADAAQPGVEADAELDRLERPPLGFSLLRQRAFKHLHLAHHAERCAAGMARMDAVVERRVPERHHRVAHEFVDGALLIEDDVAQAA